LLSEEREGGRERGRGKEEEKRQSVLQPQS